MINLFCPYIYLHTILIMEYKVSPIINFIQILIYVFCIYLTVSWLIFSKKYPLKSISQKRQNLIFSLLLLSGLCLVLALIPNTPMENRMFWLAVLVINVIFAWRILYMRHIWIVLALFLAWCCLSVLFLIWYLLTPD